MTVRNATSFAAVTLVFAMGATGCVHTELVGFDDHASKPLTAMRVKKETSYFFWSSQEYVFYSCAEAGDKLTCRRLCGGLTDVVCPTTLDNGYRSSNNIR